MQIVIDISEERFRDIQRIAEVQRESNHFKTAEQIIAKGTPLPKGHGKLIILSEDAVKREQMSLRFSCQNWISEVGLSNATVAIIEADKAERSDKE